MSETKRSPGVYVDVVKVKDLCGSPWGLGIYPIQGEEGPEDMYGFPPASMNPHDFEPDFECCTPEEVAAWRAACVQWDLDAAAARAALDSL